MYDSNYIVPLAKKQEHYDLTGGIWHDPDKLLPDRYCRFKRYGGCNNQYCFKHGAGHKYTYCDKLLRFPILVYTTYYANMNIHAYLTPQTLTKLLDNFISNWQLTSPRLRYWYRVEWICNIPHFNFVWRDKKKNIDYKIKEHWVNALGSIGHPNPSEPDIKIQIIKPEHIDYTFKYIFKTWYGAEKDMFVKPFMKGLPTTYRHPKWIELPHDYRI